MISPMIFHHHAGRSRSFRAGFTAIGAHGVIAGLPALAGPAATGKRLEQISR